MITLSASGGSVTFEFSGNSTYLNDGTITVPVNSLALIIDESDMATFRKAASNDIFVSANIAEFGMTKAELESWYKANMVGSTGGGGGGVTPSEVQTMIDESISGKTNQSDFTAYTADTSTKVSSAWSKSIRDLAWYPTASGLTLEYSILSGGSYQYAVQPLDDSLTYDENKLSVYGKGNKGDVTMNISQKTSFYYFPYIYRNLYNSAISVTTNVLVELNPSFSGSVSSKAIGVIYTNQGRTQRTAFWDYDSGTDSFTLNSQSSSYDGVNIWYDSSTKTIQIIRNYFGSDQALWIDGVRFGNFSTYIAASSNPTDASCYVSYVKINGTQIKKLQEVLDEKQDQLVAGENITISGNVISAEGGGKAIEGGRGISVTTGATADTVSISLPISAGTGAYSIIEGNTSNKASGSYSHAEGDSTTASGYYSHAEGYQTSATSMSSHAEGAYNSTSNSCEHASGRYNITTSASTAFGNSGNTLFSVGNGTSNSARHNAFEIRQNGDIYFEYDGSDVKLQDKLDEIETVTAAALNNLNDRFGGLSLVKLTQTEYDNLQTKDSNTLYVIVN